MKDIEKMVEAKCRGEERRFLLDSIHQESVFLAKGDKKSLQRVLVRVECMYASLSFAGQKIANEIVSKVKEDLNRL